MENEPTKLFGLSGDKLAHLLKDCVGDGLCEDKGDTEQQKAELLRDLLEDVLPTDPVVIERMPTLLKQLYRELLPLAGESLGSLMQNPQTNISIIRKIKDYGKRVAASSDSEAAYETSGTIYYAAIASGLVFHNQKITGYSYEQLEQYFSSLIEKKWIPPQITQLFIMAREICKQKAGENLKGADK